MQEFLNRSTDHHWGIVSNGRQLRLLRDNSSLTRTAYVEFDLQQIFDGDAYADFALLWLTCHATRLQGTVGQQVLEDWRSEAAATGVRARDALRDGVEKAIEAIGSAAVGHPANTKLRTRIEEGSLTPADLYRQVLRTVYRLLFLLVAESRGLLFDPSADPSAVSRYRAHYSVARLRDLAGSIRGGGHPDLWRQHLVVGEALHVSGAPALGLAPLGGFLWSPDSIADLSEANVANDSLLAAVRALTTVTLPGELPQRVDYANLGAEELGSIYESLLEYHPEVNLVAKTFDLSRAAGNERKTTGSYYTPSDLIHEMLKAALEPLIQEAVRSSEPEQSLLSLKVVDPAAGSGHFLIAVANRIADELARIRAGGDEPSPDQAQAALRDVVASCIYAVDLNPMAVELAKIALWIEAMEPGKPLTFLDHHVVCGNGVIGATPAMIREGIPDGAFTVKKNEGDDPAACRHHRERNAAARDGQGTLFAAETTWSPADRITEAERISRLPERTVADLQAKEAAWRAFVESSEFERDLLLADAYCASVTFARTRESSAWMVAPYDVFYSLRSDPLSQPATEGVASIETERKRFKFFHWHLAFPEVFGRLGMGSANDRCGWEGGFDLVVGNPPWETLSPDRKEFFKNWIPGVGSMSSQDQEATIDAELLDDQALSDRWMAHREDLFATARFFRRSGRYRMFAKGNLGKGDLNLYRAFVELALTITGRGGVATQVTPSGLYAGANAASIRSELLRNFSILSIWGFDNSRGYWFQGITAEEFAVYSARRGEASSHFGAAFRISSLEDLVSAATTPFKYPVSMIWSIDEESLIVPEVRAGMDARVMSKLVAGRETFVEQNRKRNWHPYRREVDMGNDAHRFTKDPAGVPVYEGRMVDFYDHRAKAYLSGAGRSSKWTEKLDFADPDKMIAPQWRILEEELPSKLDRSWERYRVGFQDVANPRRARSLVAAVIPQHAVCGDKVPTVSFPDGEEWRYAVWLAAANSLIMDFTARRRIVMKMSFTVVDGLPFPIIDPADGIGTALIDRALRLTCVSQDMEEFRLQVASSAGLNQDVGSPAAIDAYDRIQLMAEVDALMARECFELTREEFEHVLDDFTILREREERPPTGAKPGFGEFLTKRLALEAFDRLEL